jgi:hypothetical protein
MKQHGRAAASRHPRLGHAVTVSGMIQTWGANSPGVWHVLEPAFAKPTARQALALPNSGPPLRFLELQLFAFRLSFDGVARAKLAFQDGKTQRIEQQALNHAFQRARPIDRVVSFFRQ